MEAINDELLSEREEGIPAKLDQLEKFIWERFSDLRRISSKNVIAAKAQLLKYCLL